MKAERVGRKIAGVAIEQAEPGDLLHDLAVFARQQDKVVRLEHQWMANVDRERTVGHDWFYGTSGGGRIASGGFVPAGFSPARITQSFWIASRLSPFVSGTRR